MTEARMQEAVEYKPGTFCWEELGTSNAEAAKTFYTQLFGWSYVDNPMGPDMVYTMYKLDGKDVAASYELMPDQKAHGVPPNWTSYVSVADADKTVEKARAAGATILAGPFDVATYGRMATIQDPTGAVFALWQPKDHNGAGIVNKPNSFTWNELMTTDTKKAGEFYSAVFGWKLDKQNFGPMEYTMLINGDRPNGGMLQITPDMGNMPSNWLVYFAVDDCDAKVQKAIELGAKICKPADDIAGVGRFAILTDPQGAGFALIKLDNPQN